MLLLYRLCRRKSEGTQAIGSPVYIALALRRGGSHIRLIDRMSIFDDDLTMSVWDTGLESHAIIICSAFCNTSSGIRYCPLQIGIDKFTINQDFYSVDYNDISLMQGVDLFSVCCDDICFPVVLNAGTGVVHHIALPDLCRNTLMGVCRS